MKLATFPAAHSTTRRRVAVPRLLRQLAGAVKHEIDPFDLQVGERRHWMTEDERIVYEWLDYKAMQHARETWAAVQQIRRNTKGAPR